MRLINLENGKVIADKVELANSFWKRFRGLMLKGSFWSGQALVFPFSKPKRYSIHTFFMRFPIDLLYLDQELEVIESRKELSPWKIHKSGEEASILVELPPGRIEEANVRVDDELDFREKGESINFCDFSPTLCKGL
ncbi:hypothetical protein AKJ44_02190 [candidate division MSBL1 archaeon SCGC-AAA261F17]|uniref:DUF192 domain-containing protein n=1 Tax=candidate division MSBL1 archaeon SCGC-AAA261F17 TaxID=1698274 RepID=A0A133V5J4_9EURY|nr:hypothetical protein AKJ44_02190 [candidate division MSBL1 archaeon SCGC-AAA261F17]